MNLKQDSYLGKKRSLITRLLLPVNLLLFVLLSSMAAAMVFEVKEAVESGLRSKAEGMITFMDNAGQAYVRNYDLSGLENLSKVVAGDADFEYAVFFDKDGRPLVDNPKMVDGTNVIKIEREMLDPQKKSLGRVAIGYNEKRVGVMFRSVVVLASCFVILVQFVLSGTILGIAKSIIKPLQQSLDRLSKTNLVLANTSTDISKFSSYLSSGVNQQAEVVQETTAAMVEMSSVLAQAGSYARDSENLMKSVKQKATNGMNVMNQMADAMSSMQQVNDQLKQMVDIIHEIVSKTNVINDIVFKTQLLSFNASIEAARAGQHGRGFAVVAEEVGNLAKTSGAAAQQIAILLVDSERRVNEIVGNTFQRLNLGKTVTEQALGTFEEIAADINLMSSHVTNLASASKEQELGVAQTTQAMNELASASNINNDVAHRASQTVKVLENELEILRQIAHSIENSINGARIAEKSRAADTVQAGSNSHSRPSVRGSSDPGTESSSASLSALSTDELGQKIVEMAKRIKDAGMPSAAERHQAKLERNLEADAEEDSTKIAG